MKADEDNERLRRELARALEAVESRDATLAALRVEEQPAYLRLERKLAEARGLLRDIANREFADEEECAASAERCLKLMTSDSASVVQENSR